MKIVNCLKISDLTEDQWNYLNEEIIEFRAEQELDSLGDHDQEYYNLYFSIEEEDLKNFPKGADGSDIPKEIIGHWRAFVDYGRYAQESDESAYKDEIDRVEKVEVVRTVWQAVQNNINK